MYYLSVLMHQGTFTWISRKTRFKFHTKYIWWQLCFWYFIVLLTCIFHNYRGELVKECLEKGTELVQTIANNLFNLPSTETKDGPLIKLPPPTTRLPREKPVSSSFYLYFYIYLAFQIICIRSICASALPCNYYYSAHTLVTLKVID